MTFHSAKIRRAAKKHCCDLCGTDIAKGELYEYSAGVFQGEFYCSKLHKTCTSIISEYLSAHGYQEGWSADYVADSCHDILAFDEGIVVSSQDAILEYKKLLESRKPEGS